MEYEQNIKYAKMVTTIKITCDGVFIQSNPYFSNAHLRQSPGSFEPDNSSSLSLSSSSSMEANEISGNDDQAINRLDVVQASTSVEGGNMTVVIRNNRRRIGRSIENQEFPADALNGDIPLPRQAMRPSYHYMYMVRKVPAGRGMISPDGVVAKSVTVASDNFANNRAITAESDNNEDKSVIVNGSQEEDEKEEINVVGAADDLNRLEQGRDVDGAGQQNSRPSVDVDVDDVEADQMLLQRRSSSSQPEEEEVDVGQ